MNLKEDSNLNESSVFQEVVPLISDFGFENKQQKVSLTPLSADLLPKTVYMLVNQKVELESIPLRDFPEWSFLPDEEKDRLVINLFENQKSAKRSCGKGQRVIKIPDSNVFILTVDFLLLKGITRIIFDDLLITLNDL